MKKNLCILINDYPVLAYVMMAAFNFLGLIIGHFVAGPPGCGIGVAITAGISIALFHKLSGSDCAE